MKTVIRDNTDRAGDRRANPRYSLSGSLPGELRGEDGVQFNAMTVDISRRGLGLLIDPAPQPGAVIELEFDQVENIPGDIKSLQFTIRHVLESPIHTITGLVNMKRCGIEIIDPDRSLDLVHFFSEFDTLIIQE
ncbi:MAG: PilZ domain-containing protein [Oligoflexus sp.]